MKSDALRSVLLVVAFSWGMLLLVATGPAADAVSIDWVTVAGTGTANACDSQSNGCFGAVADSYLIGKYEVTNAQYTEFLNAVAANDTNALYNTNMGSGFGGITQGGSSGSYTYGTIAGRESMPVSYVSWYDSLRFANWLHNGQLSGAQDSTTTEDGAYTFSGPTSVGARNAGATIFLTSEDEWYKAAYFNGTSYFDYPAGVDTQIVCAAPGATSNTENCGNVVGNLSNVGSYTGSASPNGTFDQGGNAWEWNEAISGSNRGARGGSFSDFGPFAAGAASRISMSSLWEDSNFGFRVGMVPEPTTALLLATGLAGLAVARRRRSHLEAVSRMAGRERLRPDPVRNAECGP